LKAFPGVELNSIASTGDTAIYRARIGCARGKQPAIVGEVSTVSLSETCVVGETPQARDTTAFNSIAVLPRLHP
jgi:hypothetical protein